MRMFGEAGDSMGDSVFERHNKENQVLSIFHGESQIVSYYQLKAPFQLTLEFCGGISAEDYLFVKDLLFDKDKVFYEEEKLSVNNLLLDFFDTDETVTGEKAYLMFRPAGRGGQNYTGWEKCLCRPCFSRSRVPRT